MAGMTIELSGTISRTSDEEMDMNSTARALTASEARRTLFALLEQVNEDEGLAVHITSKHGTGVLIGEKHWSSIVETLYLFTDPVNSIPLMQAMLDFENGVPGIRVDPKTMKPIE
jgi:antitoxin YefM